MPSLVLRAEIVRAEPLSTSRRVQRLPSVSGNALGAAASELAHMPSVNEKRPTVIKRTM
jgi:hypothetical protein